MLTAVFLHGHLGQKYGRRFDLDVSSVAEAVALLKANFAHFARDVIGAGNRYRVWVGKTTIGAEDLRNPLQGQEVHIVPVIAGAGGDTNIFKIIIGIVLIVVDFFTDYAFGGGYLTNLGIGLIVGGVAGMVFASSTRRIKMSSTESPDNQASKYFSGPVNTVGQGNPVPILYGRLRIGSQVVSGGFTDRDS